MPLAEFGGSSAMQDGRHGGTIIENVSAPSRVALRCL